MKKFITKLGKILSIQIISFLIIIGSVTLAFSFPTNTPVGQTIGGKFMQYFNNTKGISNCPDGEFVVGFDLNFEKICKKIIATVFTYYWDTSGSYGSCSKICGGGIETKPVLCKRNDGITVADSFCTTTKPTTTQSCNIQTCNYFTTLWKTGTSGYGDGTNIISFNLQYTGTCNIKIKRLGYLDENKICPVSNSTWTYDTLLQGDYTIILETSNLTRFWNNTDNNLSFGKLLGVTKWGDGFTSMNRMFYHGTNLSFLPIDIPNISNVTDMRSMFFSAKAFNQDIGNWDTSNITNMNGMFFYATAFNQNIGSWDISNVNDIGFIFLGATSFNQPIGNWDTSKVTNMYSTFTNSISFNKPIGNWNTSKVINMRGMFNGANSFNQDIGNWDTSKVTSMSSMFANTLSFNQDIGNWNTSKVTDMSYMFHSTAFNNDISGWCVSNIKTKPVNFYVGIGNEPIWGTCP